MQTNLEAPLSTAPVLADFPILNGSVLPAALSKAPVTNPTLPNLVLGERQDIVLLDAKDRIVGYGRVRGGGLADVTHYDIVGAPLDQTLTSRVGSAARLDLQGRRTGESCWRTDTIRGYFDANCELVGEARLRNDNFAEYFDRTGAKIGAALIEPRRITILNAAGRCVGRKVATNAAGRWLAIEDAWDMFAMPGTQP